MINHCANCGIETATLRYYPAEKTVVSQCDYCWQFFCNDCCYTHNDFGVVCMSCDVAIEKPYHNMEVSLREWAMTITPDELLAAEAQASKQWIEASGMPAIRHANAALDIFQDVIYKRGLGERLGWR